MNDAENTEYIPREENNNNAGPLPLAELQGILPNPKPEKPKEAPEPTEKRVREWMQLGVNAFLAIAGTFAVCIYYGQLQVSKLSVLDIEKQLTEMQIQRDLANRAWVKIVDVVPSAVVRGVAMQAWNFTGVKTTQVVDTPQGAELSFKASFRNVGRSPVLNMSPSYELVPSEFEETDDWSQRVAHGFCTPAQQKTEADWHTALFPDEPFNETKRAQSALTPKNSSISGGKTEFIADLIVCVKYQYPGSEIIHRTAAIYKIAYKDPLLHERDWRDSFGLFSFAMPIMNIKAGDIFLKRLGYADQAD